MLPFALALALLSPQDPKPMPPALVPLPAAFVHLDGWLGARLRANREHWLDTVDLEARIEPFAHRPAKQPWAGEHLGKWLHAASLAWQESGDTRLRARLDHAVDALLQCQEPDGYLGTYLAEQRFQLLPGADWDVWTIKYALLGLLAYHSATGDARALAACRRAADLLLATFGPGKRSILGAGTHVGMAATSVLEPMARLYLATREPRYLEFCHYLVQSWDDPGGPRILSALRDGQRPGQVANAKAYEMLSNLVGLCVLYRATGDDTLLAAPRHAVADILLHELLPTGSMSRHEHFTGGGRLPSLPTDNLGETCVSVTWLQLCSELLQIGGFAEAGREIERTVYNHLLGAQRPDGASFCYYTPLRGRKPYSADMTCCSSSGARGLAMLGRCSVLQGMDTDGDPVLAFNLLGSAHGVARLGGKQVQFTLASGLPVDGHVRLTFAGELPARFAVDLRLSDWAVPAKVLCGDEELAVRTPGWLHLAARDWRAQDLVELTLTCGAGLVTDPQAQERSLATWGPCVLAVEAGGDLDHDALQFPASPTRLTVTAPLRFAAEVHHGDGDLLVHLRPFAEIGADGGAYRVWLTSPQQTAAPLAGQSAQSRPGNVAGSIRDGDFDTFAVTYDGNAATQDWYRVDYDRPITLRRVTFVHGHCFHDGGWFDASGGKPQVQVLAHADGEWQTVGELSDYPATTATDARGLRDGTSFACILPAAMTAVAVRVLGVPARGDRPQQAFSSCAELTVSD